MPDIKGAFQNLDQGRPPPWQQTSAPVLPLGGSSHSPNPTGASLSLTNIPSPLGTALTARGVVTQPAGSPLWIVRRYTGHGVYYFPSWPALGQLGVSGALQYHRMTWPASRRRNKLGTAWSAEDTGGTAFGASHVVRMQDMRPPLGSEWMDGDCKCRRRAGRGSLRYACNRTKFSSVGWGHVQTYERLLGTQCTLVRQPLCGGRDILCVGEHQFP